MPQVNDPRPISTLEQAGEAIAAFTASPQWREACQKLREDLPKISAAMEEHMRRFREANRRT